MNAGAKIRTTIASLKARLTASNNRKNIASNVLWLGFDKAYGLVLTFIVSIFVARYLGDVNFGILTYTLAFVTLFRTPANLGLEEVLVRELVRHEDKRNTILGTAFVMRMAAGTVVIGIIALVVQWAKPDDPFVRMLVILTSLQNIGQSAVVVQRWNQAKLRARDNAVAANAALTVIMVSRLLMVYFQLSLVWFAWTNVLLTALTAFFAMVLYQRSGESVWNWRFSWPEGRQMLKDCWPRIPSGIAGSLQSQLGAVMIGGMVGDRDLGQYGVAFRFYVLMLVVPDIVCQAFVPSLTRAKDRGYEIYVARLTQVYQLLFLLWIVCAGVMVLLGLFGVPLLYGQQFSTAGYLLCFMSLPLLPAFLGQWRMWFIVIENLFRYAMYMSFLMIAVTVAGNLLLVKFYGVYGAIAGMSLGGIAVLIVDFFMRPTQVNVKALLNSFNIGKIGKL